MNEVKHKKKITVQIDEDFYSDIYRYAHKNFINVSEFVRDSIRFYIEHIKQKNDNLS